VEKDKGERRKAQEKPRNAHESKLKYGIPLKKGGQGVVFPLNLSFTFPFPLSPFLLGFQP